MGQGKACLILKYGGEKERIMKYPDDFVNKIICGDCLEILKEIPEGKGIFSITFILLNYIIKQKKTAP